jgi:Zn-dependent peptidase ImmA (M78 family)/transcriptional regulator with XRE-family HTH domain
MTERATGFNPRVLTWARERAGMSIDEAARRMGKEGEVLRAWEAGEQAPTFLQLEQLADKVYHRPVALFFFPDPPTEEPAASEFRTVPEFDLDSLAPDTHYAIRDAKAFLLSIRDLAGGGHGGGRVIASDIRANLNTPTAELAGRVREYVGVTLEQQFSWATSSAAMSGWRDAVEACGVYVIKRSFKQSEIAGFCLFDREYPVIVVNNSHAFTRQIFTLFHELGHLLFGVSTIAKTGQGYVDRFAGDAQRIEVACNRFAADLLVPESALSSVMREAGSDASAIPAIADRFKVSREVILRRFLDQRLVDANTYARLVSEWAADVRSGEGDGGNYYATQATYLGKALLNLAFGQYHAGRIDLQQLAEHLNIKAANLGKLEAFLLARE